MRYVQELLFCNKLVRSTAQWTFNSYKKVNPKSLYHEKIICLTIGTVVSSLHYIYQGLVLTVNQWLCLLELNETVPSS